MYANIFFHYLLSAQPGLSIPRA